MISAKEQRRLKIKRRVRKKVKGTTEKPRLCVFRSNKEIYGQLIDDVESKTLASKSSLKMDEVSGPKKDQAFQVGKALAEVAVSNGIEEVIFDRNGYRYHGRVQRFAEGAREGGLKF